MKKKMCFLVAVIMVLGNLLLPQLASANDAGYMDTVYVCTNKDGYLNMRTEPTTKNGSGNIVAEIPDCFAVDIMYLNEDGKWGYGDCFIENGHFETGWIYLPMTKQTYEEARDNAGKKYNKTVEVASPDGELNLRREPEGREHNVLDVIYNGTVLNVTRRTDKGWGLVTYNGQKGWIKLDKYTKEYVAPTPTPEATPEPVMTPPPTQAPAVPQVQMEDGQKKVGSIRMDDDRIMSGNALVLTLIAVAVFLVVAVAILLIVVLKRSKDVSEPYYPHEPEDYGNQGESYYGAGNYSDPNGTTDPTSYSADNYGDPNGTDYYGAPDSDPNGTEYYGTPDNDPYNGNYGTNYYDESQQNYNPEESDDNNPYTE